jgi:phosphoglycolate phosphatase-like HAD superfamily hydrolase
MLLVLWDLDHTLLEVRNISRKAYVAGFERVTGARLDRLPDMTGRTDRAIIAETLRLHTLPASVELVERVGQAIGEEYAARAGLVRQNGRVLPGAAKALRELADLANVHQSVLTGNMRPIAQAKLSSLGLADHLNLEIGAFGMDDSERWRLVGLSLQRAATIVQEHIKLEDTILIGDTPLDVEAAQRAGTRMIAVATGASSVADLRAAGAEIVFDDLTDTEQLLRAVRE